MIDLGAGTNTATIAGSIGGSLRYNGRDGNDTVTIESTATITDNVFAALGNGVNVFLHNGTISGNFKAVSKNANDSITVGDTGTVGGTTTLGPGDQTGEGHGGHGCRGDHGHGDGDSAGERRRRPWLHGGYQHDDDRRYHDHNHDDELLDQVKHGRIESSRTRRGITSTLKRRESY